MTAHHFRIRDLLRSRTVLTTRRGREIVEYYEEHFRPGYDDWMVQYKTRDGWAEVPRKVMKAWRIKSEEAKGEKA